MDTREETMQTYGVLQCPDWCAQDVEEKDFEQHIGEWEDAIADGGVDNELTVRARPRREWWTDSDKDESNCEAYVEMNVILPRDGSPWLSPDEVEDLIEVLDAVKDKAATPPVWVWAYEGAENEADPDEEGAA